MTTENNQLAQRPVSVKDYLALPAYKDRFAEVLGKRAPQFLAAVTASSNLPQLKDAEPRSIIAAAMVAATLDLPVNPTLGQAHIVSYRDQSGTGIAQFQIGYKGLIQLALRSGQYKRMNAGAVNAEVFTGYDAVGEPSLDWSKFDPSKEVGGYFCAFELVNGFTKVVYWSKAQCEAHAKRFSKAYAKGYSTPWKSDFDSMATKTVVKNALTKWGILSVEMQKAAVHDQGGQADVDAEVKYVDGEDKTVDEQMPGDPAPDRPAPPPRAKRGVAAVKQNVEVVVPAEPVAEPAPAPEPTPKQATPAEIIADVNAKVAAKEKAAALTDKPEAERKPEITSFTQAAAATTEAAAPLPRAFLNDGEVLETVITVASVTGSTVSRNKVPTLAALVKSAGGFTGHFYHFGGATGEQGKEIPLPLWTESDRLKVRLLGKKNAKGEVKVICESVEQEESVPQADSVE